MVATQGQHHDDYLSTLGHPKNMMEVQEERVEKRQQLLRQEGFQGVGVQREVCLQLCASHSFGLGLGHNMNLSFWPSGRWRPSIFFEVAKDPIVLLVP